MKASDIQPSVEAAMRRVFASDVVSNEWNSRAGAQDIFADLGSYAPRPDIAVGPFNTTTVVAQEDADRIREIGSARGFVKQVKQDIEAQWGGPCWENPNPRCLVAVEIEFSGSSKHVLGDYVNASKFGLVGIIIGPPMRDDLSPKQRRMTEKIRRVGKFVRKLVEVKKAEPGFLGNVAVYDLDQFMALCRRSFS